MMKLVVLAIAGVATAAGAAPPARNAQEPAPEAVPAPPHPLCRVWYRGLPADRQPPPTDCETARREAAITGGEVVVGRTEPGGALRINEWPDRHRAEMNELDELERLRERREDAEDSRIREWERRDRGIDPHGVDPDFHP